MFNIDQSNSYPWTVKWDVPVGDGKFDVASFQAQFKRLGHDRISEIKKLGIAGEISDIDIANEVLVGWNGVKDGESEMPFTDENKKLVLGFAMVPSAIVEALFDSFRNGKRKN